jgi:hypothetical protein
MDECGWGEADAEELARILDGLARRTDGTSWWSKSGAMKRARRLLRAGYRRSATPEPSDHRQD